MGGHITHGGSHITHGGSPPTRENPELGQKPRDICI